MRTIILRIFAVAGLTLATAAGAQAQTWDCGETPGTVTATLSDGTLTISGSGAMAGSPWSGYKSSITRVVIEYGVTSIGSSAFWECTGLTSVTIPNSVTSIGDDAFWDCESLTSVTIPNSVKSIGNYAFQYCSGLTSIICLGEVPPTVGTDAFRIGTYGIISRVSLLVPQTYIDAYRSADGWKALYRIQEWDVRTWDCGATPETVTATLGEDGTLAVSGTGKMVDYGSYSPWDGFRSFITSVVIDNGVISIGSRTFRECRGLTSVTIHNSVASIGEYAFYSCSRLTSVTIPNSVDSIGQHAFSSCGGLTSVTSLAVVPPDIDTTAFNSVPVSSICLYVPPPAIDAYGSDELWKKFSCIQAVGGVLNIRFDSKGGSVVNTQYALPGSKVHLPTDPVKPDSLFDGWYKDAECTVPSDFDSDIVTSDMTFYAIYISKKYVPAEDEPMGKALMLYEFPPDSAVPAPMLKEGAVISGNQLAGEFTAGPNPVSRQSGIINFYRQGKQVASGELSIYDISGNIINRVKISDMAIDNRLKRKAGSWDLRDKNGRIVPAGTYLVRGVVKVLDGKREKVSLTIGVR